MINQIVFMKLSTFDFINGLQTLQGTFLIDGLGRAFAVSKSNMSLVDKTSKGDIHSEVGTDVS